MAEEQKQPTDDRPLSDDEKAYFDSRGEKDIPVTPTEAPAVPTEKPAVEEAPSTVASSPQPADTAAQATVPQAALHEERTRRQQAEERARQMELLNARMEERFRTLRETVTPRQQPQGPPAVDQDIFGAVKHMQQEQARTRSEIEGYKRQIQQEDYTKQLTDWGRNVEIEFRRVNPDYQQALDHLRQARGRQLQIWGMSPSAIDYQLKHEEIQMLARAAAERRNPAEMAYRLAQEAGYRRGAAQQQPQDSQRHEIDLNRIEAGQRQSGTLSNVGGGGGRDIGDIEANDLLKMSDKEFGAWIDKHPAQFRRLKGASH